MLGGHKPKGFQATTGHISLQNCGVNGESVRGVWQHQYNTSDSAIIGYGIVKL